MSQVGFEPTIPVCERAKTVHALEIAATVIDIYGGYCPIKELNGTGNDNVYVEESFLSFCLLLVSSRLRSYISVLH
jgi:hypothetical protein